MVRVQRFTLVALSFLAGACVTLLYHAVHLKEKYTEKMLVPSSNEILQSDKGTVQRDPLKNTEDEINKQNRRWGSCRGRKEFTTLKVPRLDPKIWDDVKLVVLFIGYHRSGHSLVAALLDAHPNIIMSDEYDVMKTWKILPKENRTRDYLFQNLYARSYKLAATAERSLERCYAQLGYRYHVPNQWQGRFNKFIQVIGDKDGPATVKELALRKHIKELFPRMKQAIRIPFKFIHVVRNPFDMVATEILREMDRRITAEERKRFFENPYNASKEMQYRMTDMHVRLTGGVVNLIKRYGDDVITIYNEDMIKNPSNELKRLCQFLSVPCSNNYLKDCSSIVHDSPSKSRNALLWNDGAKNMLTDLIRKTPMLQKYKFNEERKRS